MGILHGLIRTRLWAIVFAVIAAGAGTASASCRADAVDIRGDFGQARFTVELAVTSADQAKGLMFREEMARMAGMLFVYRREQPLRFWMRNTLISLDMLFIDETGTIVNIHENAVPLDETTIPSDGPARAVLEINGGMAARLGIKAGDEIRSPAMPQDLAVWACE